jgi:hypothetical protein
VEGGNWLFVVFRSWWKTAEETAGNQLAVKKRFSHLVGLETTTTFFFSSGE